jgi:hypothetical protein
MLYAVAAEVLERSRAITRATHETIELASRLRDLRVLWRNTNDAYRRLCQLLRERSDDETQQAMMDALMIREMVVELMREELGTRSAPPQHPHRQKRRDAAGGHARRHVPPAV